jgi:hypothetical protein
VWKILVVSVIFANGTYHTNYVGLKHPDGTEVTFATEPECLRRVDGVAHRARANEWIPGRATQSLPLGGLCLPVSLADFVSKSAQPRVTLDKVKPFPLPPGVLTDYTPPAAPPATGQPAPAQPAPATPAQPKR